MNNKELKQNLEKAVDAYVNALFELWAGPDKGEPCYSKEHGWWIGGDFTGVYCYDDVYCISLPDLVYVVENAIDVDIYLEWQHYCTEAAEFGFATPTLRSWHNGCPRLSQSDFDEIHRQKRELNELINQTKHKLNTNQL